MFPQRICARVLIILCLLTGMSAQSKKPLTNTDVMDMVHAGLAESTIILSIKNSGTNFDTSPQALIELKKSGVSQSVMDAMLSAASASPGTATGSSSAGAAVGDSKALMAKVVAALGGEKALNEVKATRAISNREVKAPLNTTLEVAYTTVYPDRVHVAIKSPKFTSLTVYHPPDGSFFEVNGKRQPLSEPAKVETAKSIKMGIIYIAQHANDPKYTFTINGAEKIGGIQTAILEIATENIQTRWNVDPATGRIIRVTRMVATPTGTPMLTTFEYADWRTIEGVTVPFTIIQNGVPEELKSYEINPDIPAGMFDKSDAGNLIAANIPVQSTGATSGCPVEILEVDPHHFVDTSEDPWGFALRIKYRNLTTKQIVAEKFAANFFNALHEKKESAWSYTSDQKIKPAETKNASWSDGVYVNEIGMRIGAEVWPVKVMFADETFWEDDGSMQCKSAIWATPVK